VSRPAKPDRPAGPASGGSQAARPEVGRPADLGLRPGAGLPTGMAVELDPDTRQLTEDVLFGGSPARVVRLSAAGVDALAELRGGTVTSPAGAALAGRLADTGLAHPRPPRLRSGGAAAAAVPGTGRADPRAPSDSRAPSPLRPPSPPRARSAGVPAGPVPGMRPDDAEPAGPGAALDVTVVVPVRDRAAELDRCLAAAGMAFPVLVVDDGSADPAAVAAVCATRGARLLRRDVSGGPGPARNTALAEVGSELVAFLDSDCVPPPDWIGALAGHFADPLVAAVAPRIVATDGSSIGATLDLGDRPARVAPLTRVAYVPTAALMVRRAVLGDGFDEALRYGEDVDLVWRLIEAGWRVRYEPSVRVAHADPVTQTALLRRRFHYGTSAAPLTRRHPGAVTPLILQPWPALTMAAVLARRPVLAGAAFGASTALLARRLRASGLPAEGLARPMAGGVWQTWLGTGRWCGQFAAPALAAVIGRPGGRTARTRWGRRLAAASLLAGPPLAQWARDRRAVGPDSGGPDAAGSDAAGPGSASSDAAGHGAGDRPAGPLRVTARILADQAAYGAGVYAGCLRERTLAPVLPTVSRQPFQGLGSRRAPATLDM
jgi:mycofactocin glycosyltransferase